MQLSLNYVSKLYTGAISDKAIVQQSGLLIQNHFVPGDMITADKGFLIQEFCQMVFPLTYHPF